MILLSSFWVNGAPEFKEPRIIYTVMLLGDGTPTVIMDGK